MAEPAGLDEWPAFDPRALLVALTDARVDFVVIGGIAVVLLGSARLTRDLDIVFSPARANRERLGEALVELGASLRGVDAEAPFVADATTLDRVEILTLSTGAGPLDLHRRPQGAPDYRQLSDNAERLDLGGMTVLVASIADMIAMKRAAGRHRDLADVAELEAIDRLRP